MATEPVADAEPAVRWLLQSPEPAVRHLTRRHLLNDAAPGDAGEILSGAFVSALLSAQASDGGFGQHTPTGSGTAPTGGSCRSWSWGCRPTTRRSWRRRSGWFPGSRPRSTSAVPTNRRGDSPRVARLRYPAYWHYGVLPALAVLDRMGRLDDPRVEEAVAWILRKRTPEGLWQADGHWWNAPGQSTAPEAVDWGRTGPDVMVTLTALRVLKAAGALRV